MADGTLIFDTKLDSSGLETGVSKIGSVTKSALGSVAQVGAAALAAGATAAAALTTQAVKAYADYEQLVGGVETLFKGASDKVTANADAAYKTAGLSANEYMETVTSFSASLIQSLGGDTEKAAEIADRAIIDMSDNANKMGSSMESIQNAYQGFAKGNYTMLDNLKLGYGGTKEEMARLIKDASKMKDVQNDLNVTVKDGDMSFANIANAISVVQANLGIAGTTAKEAEETISGSLAMVKSSWENVLTAMGTGDQNKLTKTINEMVNSVEKAGANLIPVVEKALLGISQLISQLAPQIAQKIPAIITQALPGLLKAGVQIIQTLSQGILNAIPQLMPTVTQVILDLAQMLIEMAPDIIKCGIEVIVQLALGIADALPDLIPVAIDAIITIVDTLIDNVDQLVDAAIQIILALADGLINALPRLIEKAPEIIIKLVTALINNAPKLIEASMQLMVTLGKGLIQAIPQVLAQVPQIITGLVNAVKQGVPQMLTVGRNLIEGIGNGITNATSWLIGKIQTLCNNALGAIKSFFGIASPSKKFKWIGEMCVEGMEEGFEDMDSVADGVTASLNNISANASGGQVGVATNGGFASALAEMMEGMGVYMDGRTVGYITADSVNDVLGKFALRRA